MQLPWAKKDDVQQEAPKATNISTLATPSSNETHTTKSALEVENQAIDTNDAASNPTPANSPAHHRGAEVPPRGTVDEKHGISETDNVMSTDEKQETLERTTSAAATTSSVADEGPGEDDETKYLKPLQLYLLTLGLALSTFVIALDNTIIATAIPRITTVFNSLDDVGWYGSSYLLTTTSLQPSFGKIYTYFNIKWTYIIALFIFEVGSVLCAAAVNSRMLIIGRAVAGVGAAGIFSGGMTIVGYSVPLRKRPIYIGLLSSMFGVASVVGPILGGALTDRTSTHFQSAIFNGRRNPC